MEVCMSSRSNDLHTAMRDMHGLEEGLDLSQSWLDEVERKLMRMEGTKVTVKREPVVEEIQNLKVGLFVSWFWLFLLKKYFMAAKGRNADILYLIQKDKKES